MKINEPIRSPSEGTLTDRTLWREAAGPISVCNYRAGQIVSRVRMVGFEVVV